MNYEDEDDSEFQNWMTDTPKVIVPPKLFTTRDEEYGPKPIKARPIQFDEDGNEVEDDGYRKPFACPEGRPVNENLIKADVITSMKLTRNQHTKFMSLGGTTWLKEQLLVAIVERDKCKRLKEKDRMAIFRAKSAANKKLKLVEEE